jgi:hypothetical protein
MIPLTPFQRVLKLVGVLVGLVFVATVLKLTWLIWFVL